MQLTEQFSGSPSQRIEAGHDDIIAQRLDRQDQRLEVVSDAHTVILNQHTELLTQILAHLPEKP